MPSVFRRTTLVPILSAVACATGCEAQRDAQDAATEVRDSAGIVIVQNRAPSAGSYRLSDAPLRTLGEDVPVEQSPLDPTAAFFGADDRIVVGDGNQVGWNAVLVYENDGRFAMKLGGPGRGPGEFGGQLWWAGPYRGDSIVAWDRRGPTGPSMKIYGADGGYARDVPIPELNRTPPKGTFPFSAGFHGAFADGALLTSSTGILEIPDAAGPVRYQHDLLATAPAGERSDTIGRYGLSEFYWDGQQQSTYLFGASAIALPYGNDLLLGSAATYEYRIIGRDGGTKRIVRKMSTEEPVESSDIEAVITRFVDAARSRGATEAQLSGTRSRVEAYPHAATMPAYSSMMVGPDLRVWVERYRWFDPWSVPPDPQPATWDVFSSEGEWLAEVVVPAGVVLLSVSRDSALGVHVDALDVKKVVVFALPGF